MPRTYKIYALVDPRDQEIHYIGQTQRALFDRGGEHCYESGQTWVSKKNQAIMKSGQQPQIIKLDETRDER